MKVVLAYSGGLDTSVILAWLREERGAEVVTYTADVGQGAEVGEARVKALETGAAEAVVEDLRDRFVTGAVFPALRAPAMESMAWRPCSTAFRISPMPPSSPAMNIPGTLVSKSGLTRGMSTPRVSVPKTRVMASAGHAVLHAPWPMQSVGLMSWAFSPITPRTAWSGCSGQAFTQEPHPRQVGFGQVLGRQIFVEAGYGGKAQPLGRRGKPFLRHGEPGNRILGEVCDRLLGWIHTFGLQSVPKGRQGFPVGEGCILSAGQVHAIDIAIHGLLDC